MPRARNIGVDRTNIIRARFYRAAVIDCVAQLWQDTSGDEIDVYWTIAGHLLIARAIMDRTDVDYAAAIVADAFGVDTSVRLEQFAKTLERILAAEGIDFRSDLPDQFIDMCDRLATLRAAAHHLVHGV